MFVYFLKNEAVFVFLLTIGLKQKEWIYPDAFIAISRTEGVIYFR